MNEINELLGAHWLKCNEPLQLKVSLEMKLGIHWGLVTRLANSASNCVVRSLIDTNTLLKSAHAVKSTLRAPKNRYR